MLKRSLFITTPLCLSLKDNQLVISTGQKPEMKQTIPIEDIGNVILEHQRISITLPLLNALSDNNVAVIICGENYMPNAMLLNLDSNTIQAEVYRTQTDANEPLKKRLWKQIIEAKIRNQSALLNKLGKKGDKLKAYYTNVKSGDSDNREGVASKIYWKEMFGKDFVRNRVGESPNNMLNYGYTLLRAAVARALMGSGLFPAFGLFHRNRYNAFPLADDIMEPYRPFVDELVFYLYANGERELTKQVKADLMHLFYVDAHFDKVTRPLELGLSITTASLTKCLSGVNKKIVYPMLQ